MMSTICKFFTKIVDAMNILRYHLAHSLILSDEEKSKRTSLAQRVSILVQGGARGGVEDGLGADWLKRKFRSSGCTRYSAEVLMA